MNDKCVVLNAKKMNFDGKLDFSILSSDVTVYDDTTKEQLSERIQGADIIVTKEMPVSGEMIQHRTCSTYCNYDDAKSEFYNAGTDEKCWQGETMTILLKIFRFHMLR